MSECIKTYTRRIKKQIMNLRSRCKQPAPGSGNVLHLRAGEFRVRLRPAAAEDANALFEMNKRLSFESLCFRYLSPRRPRIQEMKRLCRLNGSRGRVLVAQRAGGDRAIVGMACYLVEKVSRPDRAEPAIVVEDTFQSLGIGKALFDRLCLVAVDNGIWAFDAHIDPHNVKVRYLLRRPGYHVFETVRDHVVAATILLTPPSSKNLVGRLLDQTRPDFFTGWDWGLYSGR